MKRIIVLALAACMVFGAVVNASATDFKASGSMWVGYNYLDVDNGDSGDDVNQFKQRFRTQIEMIASENLYGVAYFEINQTWGKNDKTVEDNDENDLNIGRIGSNTGGGIGADGVNIQTRRMYVNFLVPSTTVNVRAGIQGLALPSAVAGSPVLDDDVAAIVASSSYNGVNLTGFFARPYDSDHAETTVDLFGAVVSAEINGATVTPYVMFANAGSSNADFNRDAQWYGAAVTLAPISDFTLSFDGIYGKQAGKDAGFMVAGKAAYAANFAAPALVAWYASGDDDSDGGIMPTIDDGTDMTPTTLVGAGAMGPMEDAVFGSPLGKWGVSLQAEEITFIEKLSHTVRVTYIQGTNDVATSDIENWDEDDRAVEFDVVNVYSMYDNLDFIVDLAYAATDFDNNNAAEDTDGVFKAAALVQYNF